MALAPGEPEGGIQVVELDMMDKKKYFPLTLVSGFTVRTILYPFSVIRTRLQVQKKRAQYSGTFDAFSKIAKYEGARGLYKGYFVSQLLIFPQMSYITTYEAVKHFLRNNDVVYDHKIRSLIGGGCASLASQTFMVPIDVVSQHLMVLDTKKNKSSHKKFYGPLNIPHDALNSRLGRTKAVVQAVYQRYGVTGFYKGYFASLAVYAPNSALWWFFYDIYCGLLSRNSPDTVPRLVLQCVAAPLGGTTTAFITNFMDVIRARIQVEGTRFGPTVSNLWEEEGIGLLWKGLSARLVQSITFSIFIILGYETIKRWSLLPEFQDQVRW